MNKMLIMLMSICILFPSVAFAQSSDVLKQQDMLQRNIQRNRQQQLLEDMLRRQRDQQRQQDRLQRNTQRNQQQQDMLNPSVQPINSSLMTRIETVQKRHYEQNAGKIWKEASTIFDKFAKSVKRLQPSNTEEVFKKIQPVCQWYIKQPGIQKREMAIRVNYPFVFSNGHKTRLISYISMEAENLPEEERAFYYSCADLLVQNLPRDIGLDAILPEDFIRDVAAYQATVKNSKEYNASFVLQSLLPVMDSFNRHARNIPVLRPFMVKAIQQPVEAGWGGSVVAAEFITHHSSEISSSLQYELDSFANQVVQSVQ